MNEAIVQQDMDDRVLMPSGNFMTAAETLNWIAFQRAENADLTGRNALWREFGFEPVLPPEVGGWDYVVAEAADMLDPSHHARMRYWQQAIGREPKNLQSARDAAARYRETRGWSAVELHLYSTGRREICARRLEKVTQAQAVLANALAAERLTTWAIRADGSDPNQKSKPAGMASAVPWELFLTHDVSVRSTGSIVIGTEPVYFHAKFRAAEVVALWPLATVQLPTPDNLISSSSANDPADAWMLAHVTERGKWKLEGAVEQCRADTGSTYRAARAAWKRLPEDLRGKPGAHK